MIKFENHLGTTEITEEYLAKLVGSAASECFGVSGMVVSTASQGIRSLINWKKDIKDKGVRIKNSSNGLVIDLNIAVTYGVNIKSIVRSIINKVKYVVEEQTGLTVSKVNVFVDTMKV